MIARWGGISGALAAALLGGCLFSDPPMRCAGGTIETTNGCKPYSVITARVMLPNGEPARQTPVLFLDEGKWLSQAQEGSSFTLDSAITDTAGNFEITLIDPPKSINMVVQTQGHGILVRNVKQAAIDSLYGGKIGLRPLVDYNGKVDSLAGSRMRVLLAGTPFSGEADSAGNFVVSQVPPEKYSVVVFRLGDFRQDIVSVKDVAIDASTVPDTLKPDTTKVLELEDFDDGDNRNKVGSVLGGGYWDAFNDVYLGGSATLLQPVNNYPANFIAAIKDAGDTARYRSLQIKYSPGAKFGDRPFSYVFAELNFGLNLAQYNLSKVEKLTFFARGSGDLVVDFLQQPGNNTGVHAVASARVTLGADWQEFTIVPANAQVNVFQFPSNPASRQADFRAAKLPPYTQPPTTWAEMGGMAQSIRFLGTGGSEFWLDNVRLHGVDVGDLVK